MENNPRGLAGFNCKPGHPLGPRHGGKRMTVLQGVFLISDNYTKNLIYRPMGKNKKQYVNPSVFVNFPR